MDTMSALLLAAVVIGVGHTLAGPDHYLPFVAISASRGWSMRKTALVTVLCGVGHVLSSVMVGFAGLAAGRALGVLEGFESARGEVAAWMMFAFGLAMTIWGIRQGVRRKVTDSAADATIAGRDGMQRFVLFTVFVFGPCEPLIPLLIYPAAGHDMVGAVAVSTVFLVATVMTMTTVVLLATFGLKRFESIRRFRYSQAVAGVVVTCGGIAMLLGL